MNRTLVSIAAAGVLLGACGDENGQKSVSLSSPPPAQPTSAQPTPAAPAAQPAVEPASVTNLRLIAAMPEGAESVWVQRNHMLAGTGFAWLIDPSEMEASLTSGVLGEHAGDLWPVAQLAAIRAGIVVQATGGSDFKDVKGLGLGDAVLRYIAVTKGDLSGLRRDLDAGQGAKGVTRTQGPDGMIVYSARSVVVGSDTETIEHDVVVALPDDHTLVIGATAEEARSMSAALARPAAEARVPTRWAAVAETMKLESPVVVLRTYERARASDPSSPTSRRREGKRADVTAFGAAIESTGHATLKLTALSPDPAKAAAAYEDIINGLSVVKAADGRFTGEMRFAGVSGPGGAYLLAMHLFGFDVAI